MGGPGGPRSRPALRKPTRYEAARNKARLGGQRRYVQPPMADPSRNLPPHPTRDIGVPNPDKITGARSWLEQRAQRPLVRKKSRQTKPGEKPGKVLDQRPKGLWRRIKSWLREPVRSPYRPKSVKVRGWPAHEPVSKPVGGTAPGRGGPKPVPGVRLRVPGAKPGGGGAGGVGAGIAAEIIRGGIKRGIERHQAEKLWHRVANHGFEGLFSGAKTIEPWRPGRKTPPPSLVQKPQAPIAPGAGVLAGSLRVRRRGVGGERMPRSQPKAPLPQRHGQRTPARHTERAKSVKAGESLSGPMPWDLPKSWLPGKGPQQSIHIPVAPRTRSRPRTTPKPLSTMPWDLPKSWLPVKGPQ